MPKPKKSTPMPALLKMTGMPYFYFTDDELVTMIEANISKTATHLYCYMRLNCDKHRSISHRIDYKNLSTIFGMHRTSMMRALSELEDAKLISPRNASQGETYDLPFCAYAGEIAGKSNREKQQQAAKRKYHAEKHQIENVLARRLTHPEIKRLKEKHGI